MPIISDLSDGESFTPIHDSVLQDARLSLKARGLLVQMLSHPDDWTFYISQLTNETANEEDAVRSALDELIDRGYVLRKDLRDEKGRFSEFRYLVLHKPVSEYDVEDLQDRLARYGFADSGSPIFGDSRSGPSAPTKQQNERSNDGTQDGDSSMNNNNHTPEGEDDAVAVDPSEKEPSEPPNRPSPESGSSSSREPSKNPPKDDELFNRLVDLGIAGATAREFTRDPDKRDRLEEWIDALEWEVNQNDKGTGFVVYVLENENYDPTDYEQWKDGTLHSPADSRSDGFESDPEKSVDWDQF